MSRKWNHTGWSSCLAFVHKMLLRYFLVAVCISSLLKISFSVYSFIPILIWIAYILFIHSLSHLGFHWLMRNLSKVRKYWCLESSVSGIRYSKCKGPEARACLSSSRNSGEACVTGAAVDGKSRRSEVNLQRSLPRHLPEVFWVWSGVLYA